MKNQKKPEASLDVGGLAGVLGLPQADGEFDARLKKPHEVIQKIEMDRPSVDESKELHEQFLAEYLKNVEKNGEKDITYEMVMANSVVFCDNNNIIIIVSYLFWVVSMGCIGAIAFIGMNAISAQHDITFDISNARLLYLRIVLGGLFARLFAVLSGQVGRRVINRFASDPLFAPASRFAANWLSVAQGAPLGCPAVSGAIEM